MAPPDTPFSPDSLKRQLERARFERAMEVVEGLALHRALLTTGELARLNVIVSGLKPDHGQEPDPWRQDPVTLTLPDGGTETLTLIGDPKVSVRERLHRATEIAETNQSAVIDAAVDIYVGLVQLHAFRDANRRTAVLAAHYFLYRYGAPISGMALHEIGLGDIRKPEQVEALRETIKQMAMFAARRK